MRDTEIAALAIAAVFVIFAFIIATLKARARGDDKS